MRRLILLAVLAVALPAAELRILCTVPDLADLVGRVGGDRVTVDAVARPGDNPHFVQVRPSTISALSRADALVMVGLDLEVGWVPALIRGARNRAVRPGAPGYIDCSAAIAPLGLPTGPIDRAMGDVHPHGNPHYLLSPACTIQVVALLGERLAVLDTADADGHRERAAALASELAAALYGTAAAGAHPPAQLVAWHLAGELTERLGELEPGGWLDELAPLAGAALIDDHSQWPYFAACYDLRIVGHLEPKAGIPPSSAHIRDLVTLARQQAVRAVITAPWFDPRHARSLAAATELPVVPLAHQAGALPGTDTVLDLHATNVAALAQTQVEP